MPQVTNRSLIGQMAATPTGPGTVYTSMLKARASNQERVSLVNQSENVRLKKVKNVMDRNSRHAQWQSDQQMEQLRKSLVKLEAFRRVLREDFPVNNFIRHRSSDHSLGTTEIIGPAVGSEKHKSDEKNGPNHYSASKMEDNLSAKDKDGGDAPATICRERPAGSGTDDTEKLTLAIPSVVKGSLVNKQNSCRDEGSKRVSFLRRSRPDSDEPSLSHKLSSVEDRKKIPTTDNVQNSPQEAVTSSIADTRIEARLAERKQQTMRRRNERREKMEEKIVWRGFDMNTLGSEIDRKLKVMDPKRKRKRAHTELASYNRRQNERIIADSRDRFISAVMTTDRDHVTQSSPVDHKDEVETSPRQNPDEKSAATSDDVKPIADEPQLSVMNPLLHKIPLFT